MRSFVGLAVCALALAVATPALAVSDNITARQKHVFVEESDGWKATCDRAPDVEGVFCRIMAIDRYKAGANPSFVHFGMAWAPEAMGFVIASYMGFKEESSVKIGVDRHERFSVPGSRTNTISLGPRIAEPLLAQMLSGHKMVLYFFPKTGVRHLTLVDLDGFKVLHEKLEAFMAKENRPEDSTPTVGN